MRKKRFGCTVLGAVSGLRSGAFFVARRCLTGVSTRSRRGGSACAPLQHLYSMDKKNTVIGVIVLIAAFAALYFGNTAGPAPAPAPVPTAAPVAGEPSSAPAGALPTTAFAAVAKLDVSAQMLVLENDYIKVRLTDLGGAIQDVSLKKYPAVQGKADPYVLNELHVEPLLGFTRETAPALDRSVRYDVVSRSEREIVFRTVLEGRIEVLRRYVIAPSDVASDKGDPYLVRHELTFRNVSTQTAAVPSFALAIGTAAPVNAQDIGQYLSTGYRSGDDSEFVKRSNLEGGGFLGFGATGPIPYIENVKPISWASVENQFFVSLVTPDQPARSLTTRRVELPPFPGASVAAIGVSGSVGFEAVSLAANESKTIGLSLYTGPKEYPRLSNADVFKQDEDAVMQYGFFRFFSKMLITMMNLIHGWVGNWGVAIILTTLTLKLIFLPLTLSASKSAKRMQKLQPELTALREKYKDNPQKMNQATMELFKEHRVNPLGGCLPILVTIPFFMGFFSMLQSTAELRFAPFLWASDLSMPDTIAHVFGLPINIMPILMGATMVIQMRLTPQPTVDNVQAKMFKFMPYIFALFCYGFSCALSLYSTVNGIFTIVQQVIINRMKDEEPAPAAPTSGGRKVKNVTPKK